MVWCIEKITIIPSLFNHFQSIASFIHLDLTLYWLPVEQQTAASPLLQLISVALPSFVWDDWGCDCNNWVRVSNKSHNFSVKLQLNNNSSTLTWSSCALDYRKFQNMPAILPPQVCPRGVTDQDRTPQDEQRWRPTTIGVKPTDPTMAPALLRVPRILCCFVFVPPPLPCLPFYYFFLFYCYVCNSTACWIVYYYPCIMPLPPLSLFPPLYAYKLTLPSIVDYQITEEGPG